MHGSRTFLALTHRYADLYFARTTYGVHNACLWSSWWHVSCCRANFPPIYPDCECGDDGEAVWKLEWRDWHAILNTSLQGFHAMFMEALKPETEPLSAWSVYKELRCVCLYWYYRGDVLTWQLQVTHRGWNIMVDILQTAISNDFLEWKVLS